jgi:hypothetical protein
LQPGDVQRLTDWRNRFASAFLTEFQATTDRTARWLTEVVGPNDSKILFMVDDPVGRTFAYAGIDFIDWTALSGEADAIVRGGDAPPGTMTEALRTLMAWARGQLGLHELGVRVRSDNTALEFYRKIGFREMRRVALREVAEADRVALVEDPSRAAVDPSLVYMRFDA